MESEAFDVKYETGRGGSFSELGTYRENPVTGTQSFSHGGGVTREYETFTRRERCCTRCGAELQFSDDREYYLCDCGPARVAG